MHPEPASLRPYRLGPEAAEACASLDRLVLDGLWSVAQWTRELENPGSTVLGLDGGDGSGPAAGLLGLACGQAIVDDFHLTAVAISPDWRRRGLALLLLRALLAEARHQGCRRATLEVDRSNSAAVGLYRRLGFETEGVRRAYYRNGGDALIQWVDL